MQVIIKEVLAQNVLLARESLTMSQRQFALCMDCSQATVISYEQGHRVPSLEFMAKLAALTKMTIDQLMNGVVVETNPLETTLTIQLKKKLKDISNQLELLHNTL